MDPGRMPVAIIGMSVLYPGCPSLGEYWRSIVEARDHITEVPPSRWATADYWSSDPGAADRTYSRRGGFIPDLEFDAIDWGITPAALASTDPVQLLTLLVSRAALLDALGDQLGRLDGDRVSVFIGASGATQLATTMAARLQRPAWRSALRASGVPDDEAEEICSRIADQFPKWTENVFPGYLNNVISGRVANRLDLRGTNCTTDAACASSLAALKMAAQELWLGDAELAIVGGADALCDPLGYLSFAKCSALSKTDDCRPFSSKADGTIISEGVGVVVLERLADAERHGRRIYAVIRGVGSSSDGRGTAIYAPSKEGQALAMRRAYERAGFGPETVELLEAHGTGTPAGELAEVEAAREVFDASGRTDRRWCALGSVKSQIGHTKAAAGVAGLVKAALALHHKVIPPTAKVDEPNPKLHLDSSPFHVSTQARPWLPGGEHPRRAGVSSFGFGGTNFHVVLEEYTGAARPAAARLSIASSEVVAVVGADRAAVVESCTRLAEVLAQRPAAFATVARDSRRTFSCSAPVRVTMVAASAEELVTRLRATAQALRADGPSAVAGVNLGTDPHQGRLAFLFPGQGSQYLSMGGGLAMQYDAARAPWELAASLPLDPAVAVPQVVFPAPTFAPQEIERQGRQLTATEWAQPALAAASLSWLTLLREVGLRPDCAAGHSFGELVALRAAGVLSDEDLLRAARRRGELMRDAARGEGAMTAVSAPLARVEELLRGVDGVVVANHNSPSQVVVSGRVAALEAVERELTRHGLSFTRLSVATAFHSPLVSGCAASFQEYLATLELQPPQLEVYGNTDAAPYPADAEAIRATLARQLASPVRFVDQIEAMYAAGARTFVEVGPRAVLSKFVAAILKGRPHRTIAVDDGSGSLRAWQAALAQLAAAGLPVDLGALDRLDRPASPPAERQSKVALRINGALRTHAPAASSTHRTPAPPVEVKVPAPVPAVAAHPDAHGVLPLEPHRPPAPAPAANATALLRRRLAEVHARYQRAMTEAHLAFVSTAESSLQAISAKETSPSMATEALTERGWQLPSPAVMHARRATAPEAQASAAVAPPPGPTEVRALPRLTEVIASKTGFPVEAIRPDMDLEQDLGVDSIKRVEILTELRSQFPVLAGLAPATLAPRRTLVDIATLLDSLQGAPLDPPAPVPAPSAAATSTAPLETIRAVISEKTGFPPETIRPDMDFQDDLGIDSIKRVEVFVALRGVIPGLAAVPASELAPLRTILQLEAFLAQRTR